ncbi:hypothetical protein [Longimicrobium sp.]|uniref:hypothetical protein n=1 Tax=Longimicrobium sp. TaxID=2029185 RepID=UPI002C783CA7|nr:hypothetical protein [Longimicrobium sp.]HSU12734.1 hypothetical protein [Longimicrobium sp.]
MYLIQILLPLRDNEERPFPRDEFDRVRRELTERFGGTTFYTRAPAVGLWKDDEGEVSRDEVIVAEVMAEHQDREWWRLYRETLEGRFRQDQIVVRAMHCGML